MNKDFSLDFDTLEESEVEKCDLIIAQHFVGFPVAQIKLFDLAKKFDIPILEDLVQSGSLYSRYNTHESLGRSHCPDVAVWSCGMDKIPSALGGGLGYFAKTQHGVRLFEKANAIHETFPIDSLNARFVSLVNQFIWKMITGVGPFFWVLPVTGFVFYIVGIMKRGHFVKWYEIALSVRSSKTVVPFAHEFRKFLRRPNRAHLLAIAHSMSPAWVRKYNRIAQHERRMRKILLENMPEQCREKVFPWLTQEALAAHLENEGAIAEFTWACAPPGERERLELLEHMNDWFVMCIINTSWLYWEGGAPHCENSKAFCDGMLMLPNFRNMNDRSCKYVARALTAWCEKKYPEK